ncbi:hypothetical protein HPB47_003168 [Ixodes persulcatus]|uniref:Uncharacterized protein n=1 Tax=Ixodes persulcatus TaxID=34615 RepID=A0AC60PJC6_IXOPE|nr:hypothetical protein HPB47_003168 [Ixodes persulcatus]
MCKPRMRPVVVPYIRMVSHRIKKAPIHKTQAAMDTIQERNTNLVYVPAGCTSLPQPGDVFWNKPFEASFRRTWEAFIRKEEKTAEETCESFPGRTCSS